METIVKIKNSVAGKKLIAHLKSLEYVKVLGDSDDFLDVKLLHQKVKQAEKSKSVSFEDAIRLSETWKTKRG
jgi:hypothetical protein